jgi:hypothetical protein
MTRKHQHAAMRARRTPQTRPADVPSDRRTLDYFGGCPVCGQHDGYLNIYRAHFFHCRRHRTCWQVGENLFRSWRQQTPEDWARNYARLRRYRLVEPLMPPPEDG